jgi:hypothetical protein
VSAACLVAILLGLWFVVYGNVSAHKLRGDLREVFFWSMAVVSTCFLLIIVVSLRNPRVAIALVLGALIPGTVAFYYEFNWQFNGNGLVTFVASLCGLVIASVAIRQARFRS